MNGGICRLCGCGKRRDVYFELWRQVTRSMSRSSSRLGHGACTSRSRLTWIRRRCHPRSTETGAVRLPGPRVHTPTAALYTAAFATGVTRLAVINDAPSPGPVAPQSVLTTQVSSRVMAWELTRTGDTLHVDIRSVAPDELERQGALKIKRFSLRAATWHQLTEAFAPGACPNRVIGAAPRCEGPRPCSSCFRLTAPRREAPC
jgi:hypothetical protein